MHTTIVNLPARVNGTVVGTVWGGHAIRDGPGGPLHWFGSAIRDNGTLAGWTTKSTVAHARVVACSDHGGGACGGGGGGGEAPSAANATFALDDIVLEGDGGPGWAGGSLHGVYAVANPSPWANQTDRFLIFFTGMTVADPLSTRKIGVAHAPSLDGPWRVWPAPVLEPNGNASAVDTSSVSNAAPAFDLRAAQKGRILLAYKGLGVAKPSKPVCTDGSGKPCVFVASAPHWSGPYDHATANAGDVIEGEDPTLFQDARGGWHLIKEHYIDRGLGGVGGHCYSETGVAGWVCSDPSTWYTTRVVLDGAPVTLSHRERPQLVFDGGAPVALYNGVCVGGACFNAAMPFNATAAGRR